MSGRVLILGGTGMLGHKLAQVFADDGGWEVHATVRTAPPRAPFAPAGVRYHAGVVLDSADAVARVMDAVAPDVVLNAVGAIKQKDLRAAVDDTLFVNGALPHLPALLAPVPCRVVHFSTDCVFRGDRGMYTEDQRPDAEDLYGRSKAVGEMDYGPHLTLRTSIVGWELGGFLGLLSWMMRQPRGSTLSGYHQAIYSGLPTLTLARTVLGVLRDAPALRGLYHVASEPIDKLTLLRRVSEALELGHTFVPSDAVRMDRSLNDERFRAATGTATPGWDALVADLAADWRSLPYDTVYHALASA
ncbi:MAG TPA: sugar nucleotide-binding protein [Longimicrobium sp.]|nr:sugar nucleotide-binding protein [Longimicrobium sp.]